MSGDRITAAQARPPQAGTRAMRLDQYLNAKTDDRFSWSRHNCCHVVAGWVQAETGTDPMRGLPWTHSMTAAHRLIRQLGGSLAAAWTRQLGRPPVPATLARTGDVVLVPIAPGSDAVGLCAGRHAAVLTEADGLALLPMEQATICWRIDPEAASC